jgi:hypothetical protein
LTRESIESARDRLRQDREREPGRADDESRRARHAGQIKEVPRALRRRRGGHCQAYARPRPDVRQLADQPDRDRLGARAEPGPRAAGADDDVLPCGVTAERTATTWASRSGSRAQREAQAARTSRALPFWGSVRTTLPVEPTSFRPGKASCRVLRAGSDRNEKVRPVQGSKQRARGALSREMRARHRGFGRRERRSRSARARVPLGPRSTARSRARRPSGRDSAAGARSRGRGEPDAVAHLNRLVGLAERGRGRR